ncbi:MAG: hypothetical protein H6Q78_1309 [Candidatus Krumholzibacteriota bacterium]|nr:hypothetical protein [Candidatus Krumholzibacteriota bacterium]
MKATKLVAGTLAVLFLSLTAAYAGTVIVLDQVSYDQYSESGMEKMYLDANKVRVEITGKAKLTQIIYDIENRDAPVMWIIDPAEQTYTKLDAKTLKKMKGKVQEMSEMLSSYLLKASDEERAELKTKYKKQIRQANALLNFEERAKKSTYEKVAGGETVNAWPCDHFKAMFNKELYKEIWVARWSDLGVEPADLAVLSALAEGFEGFGPDLMPLAGQAAKGSEGPVNGFPVKAVYYEDGAKTVREEVREIRKEDVDPKLFALPEGYTEKPAVTE